MDANERSLQSKCQRGQQWKQSRKLVLNYMHTPYTHADSKHWMILLYCAMLRLLWDIHKIWDYQRMFWTRKPCHWNKWRWDHFIIIIIFIEDATEKLRPKEMEMKTKFNCYKLKFKTNHSSFKIHFICCFDKSCLVCQALLLYRGTNYIPNHWFYIKALDKIQCCFQLKWTKQRKSARSTDSVLLSTHLSE